MGVTNLVTQIAAFLHQLCVLAVLCLVHRFGRRPLPDRFGKQLPCGRKLSANCACILDVDAGLLCGGRGLRFGGGGRIVGAVDDVLL